jgi:hypothetical protein
MRRDFLGNVVVAIMQDRFIAQMAVDEKEIVAQAPRCDRHYIEASPVILVAAFSSLQSVALKSARLCAGLS